MTQENYDLITTAGQFIRQYTNQKKYNSRKLAELKCALVDLIFPFLENPTVLKSIEVTRKYSRGERNIMFRNIKETAKRPSNFVYQLSGANSEYNVGLGVIFHYHVLDKEMQSSFKMSFWLLLHKLVADGVKEYLVFTMGLSDQKAEELMLSICKENLPLSTWNVS